MHPSIGAEAKETLSTHRDQLERVAAELLKSKSIDGPTFYRLVGKEVSAFDESGNLAAVAAQPRDSERHRTTVNVTERQ